MSNHILAGGEPVKSTNLFESVVEMMDAGPLSIDWSNETEIAKRSLCYALGLLLSGNLDELVPEIAVFLCDSLNRVNSGKVPDRLIEKYCRIRDHTLLQKSKFIKKSKLSREEVRVGREKYLRTEYALCLTDFLIIPKPCCKLVRLAPLIPAVAAGLPAIPLIAYAAERLANFINDPLEPYQFNCTRVGNSWLHRLGIYLLHQCQVQSTPPNRSLIRLMSLVSPPPSASVKSGKATRYSDYLADPPQAYYLHEAPPHQAVGIALALELLGEFDANRQGVHYRRVERAVAFYAISLLNGKQPSIKGVQRTSGLSWADAKKLVDRPFFRKLVFAHQCRLLTFEPEPCPECEALARRLADQGTSTQVMASSESHW